MNSLEVIQHYLVESYANPGSNMEQRSAYQFSRNQIATALVDWAAGRRFNRLVDVGSSTGFLTRRIAHLGIQVFAVDANEQVLSEMTDLNISKVVDSLPDLKSMENASADLVVSTDTLYYLSDAELEIAMKRISEILEPGGYFVFNDNGHSQRLLTAADRHLRSATMVSGQKRLRARPNLDKAYWKIEAKYLFCRGLFKALRDPKFNVDIDLSVLKQRRLVKLCLNNRWLEHALWLAWPFRKIIKPIWASQWLLERICVKNESTKYLWIYQKV